MLYKAVVLSTLLAVPAFAANWALLIAGSNQFFNYRHQADVAHAHQILKNIGKFPVENIVTMMYDDVAHDAQNKFPGKLFNKPNGTDVYAGITIDYKGNDVNATNFLKVLGGDEAAMKGIGSGKVVKSTSEDNVFVYYSDHGSFGFVGMPTGGYLYAHDLNATLTSLSTGKKFKNLVFYLEACESGSMFDAILPGNEKVWAITAANPNESSYAYYYDSTLGTYLGDEFSIRWMEDSEVEPLATTGFTVEKQFEKVQKIVNESHVMKYGDESLKNLPVGEFLLFEKFADNSLPVDVASSSNDEPSQGTDVRDVEIEILRRRLAEAKSEREAADIQALLDEELSNRGRMDDVFSKIVYHVTHEFQQIDHPFNSPRDFVCLKNSVEEFEARCGSLQGYGFKYGRTIAALCDLGYGFDAIKTAIHEVCPATIIINYF